MRGRKHGRREREEAYAVWHMASKKKASQLLCGFYQELEVAGNSQD